jgi:hypothetical protein
LLFAFHGFMSCDFGDSAGVHCSQSILESGEAKAEVGAPRGVNFAVETLELWRRN